MEIIILVAFLLGFFRGLYVIFFGERKPFEEKTIKIEI